MQATPARPTLAPAPANRDLSDMLEDIEPLALSPSQILDEQDDDDPMAGLSFNPVAAAEEEEPIAFAPRAFAPPELVEAEDIAFDIAEPEAEPESEFAALLAPEPEPAFSLEAAFEPEPEPAFSLEAAFEPEPEPEPVFTPPPAAAFRPQPSVAQAAPMPDPTLSSDMAEQLIEPATQSAIRSSITKLNRMSLGTPGATIESLMRDMLRPMLKEWLDENLPSVVERMVEKEIARVARGE
jgi:cell pole-organizing protein PopZ